MKKTPVHIPENPIIDYASKFLFLGSCFSENLSEKMKESGFSVSSNPFGVVYNPIALAYLLLCEEKELKASVFERNGVFLSWLANSTCFAYSKKEMQTKLIELRQAFLNQIPLVKVLFVTFGTAWVYEHKTTGRTVANCHKIPQKEFEKRLLEVHEIVELWQQVFNALEVKSKAQLTIVFTVSPVRHTKDGLVGNNRSKAVLTTAIHQMKEQSNAVGYFPAYEMMMDEMRDYAYYTKDGIHPNEIAIEAIWERVRTTYFTHSTMKTYTEYEKLRRLLNHRSLHPDNTASNEFEKEKSRQLKVFKREHPEVNFNSNK